MDKTASCGKPRWKGPRGIFPICFIYTASWNFSFLHGMTHRSFFSVAVFLLLCKAGLAQDITRYDQFQLKGEELYWLRDYRVDGGADSVRRLVVRMLKSKFFTFNVVRTESGYNGEINHYKVDCKKYDRTYLNTPRMYWEGEWTGKFIVDVFSDGYKVTVYALYFEKPEKSTGYYKTEKLLKGRYFEAVTKKNGRTLRRNEFSNLALMSMSLKDDFDVKNTVVVDTN